MCLVRNLAGVAEGGAFFDTLGLRGGQTGGGADFVAGKGRAEVDVAAAAVGMFLRGADQKAGGGFADFDRFVEYCSQTKRHVSPRRFVLSFKSYDGTASM